MEWLNSSLKEILWHRLRSDLAQFCPDQDSKNKLMCCVCGRFLSFDQFSLEHIIPQQALADDPTEIRAALTANQRSGNILLCKAPLKLSGTKPTLPNGCNGWKGSHYDRLLRNLFSGVSTTRQTQLSNNIIIAALAIGYLAMVFEFGYQVAVTASGILMRRQFYSPRRFDPALPTMSQVIATGGKLRYEPDFKQVWEEPFRFYPTDRYCAVGIRNFSIVIPTSRDPSQPFSKILRVVPAKYILRPNFKPLFM